MHPSSSNAYKNVEKSSLGHIMNNEAQKNASDNALDEGITGATEEGL